MSAARLPRTLLIVDDRADVRRALGRFFGTVFERVEMAATPEEALARLERASPDVVLTDYWLGNEHPPATQLVPGWRAQFPCVKVVVLMTGTKSSALQDVEVVDAVFPKPLHLKDVRAYIEEALSR